MTWNNDAETTLQDVKDAIGRFTADRDWGQFHTLKNLAMAVVSEAAELMAHFRWSDQATDSTLLDDVDSAREVRHEVADVLMLLAEFANVAKIDLAAAVAEKLEVISQRYPVEKARGTATKYHRLATEKNAGDRCPE